MSDLQAGIPAVCEVHGGSGRVVVRRDGDRLVPDGRANHCCMLTLEGPAVTLIFDVLGELLG